MGKRTRITIETDSLVVLRKRVSLRAFCPQCHAQAEMIHLNNVTAVSNLSGAGIQAWVEPSAWHQIPTEDGAVLICLNSMLKQLQRTEGAEQTFG